MKHHHYDLIGICEIANMSVYSGQKNAEATRLFIRFYLLGKVLNFYQLKRLSSDFVRFSPIYKHAFQLQTVMYLAQYYM